MKQSIIVQGQFHWIPPDKRKSRFGGPMSPRTPEKRTPLLWLVRDKNCLYLVNDTGTELEEVIGSSSGYMTADDTVFTASSADDYHYKYVPVGAAVKVDEFDGFYDCDWLLQTSIVVKSSKLGNLQLTSPPEKGGVDETVLLWDTLQYGKNVRCVSVI